MKRLILGAFVCSGMLLACNTQQSSDSAAQKLDSNPVPVEMRKERTVVDNMMSRRSVRDYTSEPVSQEKLETIMQCAINASSANNKQSWEVRVVQNPELLAKMRAIHERATYNSPVVIFVARDTENRFSMFDCGLLTENIVLAAESMDLGTVIVGSVVPAVLNTPEGKEIVEALDLPENYEVVVGICLGHKNERPDAKERDADKVKYIR